MCMYIYMYICTHDINSQGNKHILSLNISLNFLHMWFINIFVERTFNMWTILVTYYTVQDTTLLRVDSVLWGRFLEFIHPALMKLHIHQVPKTHSSSLSLSKYLCFYNIQCFKYLTQWNHAIFWVIEQLLSKY
jgi:hypothetical protein